MAVFSGPEIENSNQIFSADIASIKSYAGSGDVWKNVVDGYSSTGSSVPSYFNNPSTLSAAPLTALTVICVVTLLGTSTAYAYHPVSKWNTTTDATFVLYHFLDFTTPGNGYKLGWYANRGGVWGGISPIYQGAINTTYHVAIQYNSTNGGQMWVNGSKVGSRTASGTLMNNNINIAVDGGPSARASIHNTKEVAIYNTELTDAQIIQHFQAVRGKYGL
jgi:hypothetical protein